MSTERGTALTTLSDLGWLATVWHNKFSTEELAAVETVKGALRRLAELDTTSLPNRTTEG